MAQSQATGQLAAVPLGGNMDPTLCATPRARALTAPCPGEAGTTWMGRSWASCAPWQRRRRKMGEEEKQEEERKKEEKGEGEE